MNWLRYVAGIILTKAILMINFTESIVHTFSSKLLKYLQNH